MSKFEALFDYLNEMVMPEDIEVLYNELKSKFDEREKPLITENGLWILEELQHFDKEQFTAKEVAEALMTTSRKVSGSIRKLVIDGFVNKEGQSPVKYSLSEKGKNFNIKDYKERLNDAKDDE